jgi:hypothetical protein
LFIFLVDIIKFKRVYAFRCGQTILIEWTTPDFRNTPSTTNLEEEEIVDALGNDGNASISEQVYRPNPWRVMMMMIKLRGEYLSERT